MLRNLRNKWPPHPVQQVPSGKHNHNHKFTIFEKYSTTPTQNLTFDPKLQADKSKRNRGQRKEDDFQAFVRRNKLDTSLAEDVSACSMYLIQCLSDSMTIAQYDSFWSP